VRLTWTGNQLLHAGERDTSFRHGIIGGEGGGGDPIGNSQLLALSVIARFTDSITA
jgi:hypothetical protein